MDQLIVVGNPRPTAAVKRLGPVFWTGAQSKPYRLIHFKGDGAITGNDLDPSLDWPLGHVQNTGLGQIQVKKLKFNNNDKRFMLIPFDCGYQVFNKAFF